MDIVSFKKQNGEPFSDEELVLSAQSDSSDSAMLELLRRMTPFIISKSNQFGFTEQDKQDYKQEGIVGFLKAVQAYKPESNVKFSTFACTCILNRMKNLLRQRSKGSEFQLFPLSELQDTASCHPTPEEELQAAFEAENIINAISKKLSAYEKSVLALYLQDKSYAEIAVELNKSAKSVDNAMQRIRNKLNPENN